MIKVTYMYLFLVYLCVGKSYPLAKEENYRIRENILAGVLKRNDSAIKISSQFF